MTPAERKRELARERQRRKRLRDKDGVSPVTIKADIAELGDLLRDAEFLPPTAEDDPATLAKGLEKMLAAMRERDMRDNADFRNVLQSQRLVCPFCQRDFLP